jgi:AcrR family transcriptional regulator
VSVVPPPEPPASGRTARGEDTRQRIVDAALALFRERGYDDTTMRAVAERAGVALGNAYYYFASKDDLLQAYYLRSHEAHAERVKPVLAREKTLEARLAGVLSAKVEGEEPYHRFAGLLFRSAADPQSPLNPFSPQSNSTRQKATKLMAEVLAGSKQRIPKDLAARLPELLWLFEMGVILFWIHDTSPGRVRTHALIAQSTALVVKLIGLASNPLLAPLRKRALALLDAIGAPAG